MPEEEKDQPQAETGETKPDPSVKPPTYDKLVEGGYSRIEIARKGDKSQKEEK
ncbi:hypothetical protein ACFL2Q_01015 [Thermodesulfobacteriota bacterium]